MIGTDLNTMSTSLALSIAEFDARVSLTMTGTLVRAEDGPAVHVARVQRRLAGPGNKTAPADRAGPALNTGEVHIESEGKDQCLPVALLQAPHGTTKRDYNYFDALNAELAATSIQLIFHPAGVIEMNPRQLEG